MIILWNLENETSQVIFYAEEGWSIGPSLLSTVDNNRDWDRFCLDLSISKNVECGLRVEKVAHPGINSVLILINLINWCARTFWLILFRDQWSRPTLIATSIPVDTKIDSMSRSLFRSIPCFWNSRSPSFMWWLVFYAQMKPDLLTHQSQLHCEGGKKKIGRGKIETRKKSADYLWTTNKCSHHHFKMTLFFWMQKRIVKC